MRKQRYGAWFTEYPSTHERAGETVEVVTRETYDTLRRRLVREMALTRTHTEMVEELGADYERWLV